MAEGPYIQPNQLPGLGKQTPVQGHRVDHGPGFNQLLDQYKRPPVVSDLKFSTHALQRLERRNIQLSPAEHQRVLNGVQQLDQKGIKEGLVVVDAHRFVVSVANKTVITAMTAKDQDVYTNIQGVAFS